MLQTLSNTVTPLLWGGILALLLNLPLCVVERQLTKFERPARRVLGLTLVLLGLVVVLFFGLWLLIPQLVAAINGIGLALPTMYQQLQDYIAELSWSFYKGEAVLSATVFSTARVEAASETAVSELMNIGVSAATYTAQQLIRFVIAILLAIYLLANKENLAHKATLVLKAVFGTARGGQIVDCGRHANKTFASFMIGQCLEVCILSSLFVLVLFFTGMPSVLPIATVIGVTAFIPVFGSFVGCAFGFLMIVATAPAKSIWFLILFVFVQQFENNVIYPRVVGARVGLPPLWVILAVMIGGGLFGFAGLLLGVPAMSVLYELGGEWVHSRVQAQENIS